MPITRYCMHKLWRFHHHQHWAQKQSIENLHKSTNQVLTPTLGYCMHKALKASPLSAFERKSDLLITYMNQRTKHQHRLPGINQTSLDSSHTQTKQTTGYRLNKPWQQPHMNQTEIVACTSTNAGHRVLYKALMKASPSWALSARAIYW